MKENARRREGKMIMIINSTWRGEQSENMLMRVNRNKTVQEQVRSIINKRTRRGIGRTIEGVHRGHGGWFLLRE